MARIANTPYRIAGVARTGKPRPARWQRSRCTACGAPVRIGEEALGNGRLRGTLVDDEPVAAPGGALIRRKDGFLVRDPQVTQGGKRWQWHHCPVRNGDRVTYSPRREKDGTP
jgi:hypothetical protein